MPEENWGVHGGIPACDLCHLRKVKCDRRDPCKNCTTAKAECLRTRHKRTPRPRVRTDDKIRALGERLASLEDTWQSGQATTTAAVAKSSRSTSCSRSESTSPLCTSTKRKRSRKPSPQPTTFPTPGSDISHHQTSGARILVQEELSYNGGLSVNQRTALETAVSFVDQISLSQPVPSDRSTWSKKDAVDIKLSQREVLHIVLGMQSKSPCSATFQLHVLDHIPQPAFEKIALRLMNEELDEQTTLLSLVIVHFKAAVIACRRQWTGTHSNAILEHLHKVKVHHTYAALSALDRVSFLAAPSLLLMQALITGAMLMQLHGDPNQCWFLTSAASRIAVALGYHTLKLETKPADEQEEIGTILAWACHLDKSLGMLLCRPASLPQLPISPAKMITLDPTNHMSAFVSVMMDMAPISGEILDLFLAQQNGKRENPPSYMAMKVRDLHERMRCIYKKMSDTRPAVSPTADLNTALHWYTLDFKYFSTLTSVHRLSPTLPSNPSEREECLRCARRALQAVNDAQRLGYRHGYFNEEYNPYLSWTIISYPLCPFFVVFCNVVGTLCPTDFQLLQDVTDGVDLVAKGNRYVSKLHKLCVMLIDLIRPLVQGTASGAASAPQGNPQLISPQTTPMGSAVETPFQKSQVDMAAALAGTSPVCMHNAGSRDNIYGGEAVNSWDDNMMWQLFQANPSLEWFNSDMLNSGLELPDTNLGL